MGRPFLVCNFKNNLRSLSPMLSDRMTKKKVRTIHEIWADVFIHFSIASHVSKNGYFDITADQLRPFGRPRLLCKIDFAEKVPKVFQDNSLSILAIENGTYRIASTDPFFKIDLKKIESIPVSTRTLPKHLVTLDAAKISGEFQALDAAVASGMMSDFIGEDVLLTVRGRRRSSKFTFHLSSQTKNVTTYEVQGVQIEIDGGYEGKKSLTLIEAKNSVSKTMNIRQILYPQVHFENEVSKSVNSAVLFYDRGSRVFNFIPLSFNGSSVSVDYADTKRYKLIAHKASILSKLKDLNLFQMGKELTVTTIFPQANDFRKVLSVFDKVAEKNSVTREEALEDVPVKVVGRQLNYYTDALAWMGLVEIHDQVVTITELGKAISVLDEDMKLAAFEHIIFSDRLAQEMLKLDASEFSSELLEKYGISKTTPARRQSTMKRWKKFFEEYEMSF